MTGKQPTNPVRGEVTLDLGDGMVYTLRPDFEALVGAEQAAGRGIVALARSMMNREATITEMVAVVRGAIVAAGGMPPADLGPRLIKRGLPTLMAQVGVFLAGAIGGGDAGNADGAPANPPPAP